MRAAEQLIKSKKNDLKELFLLDFIDYALHHGKPIFAESWIDDVGAFYNKKWKAELEKGNDICIYICVTENCCRSEIMFYNNSKGEFSSYRKKLLNKIEGDKDTYSKLYETETESGLDSLNSIKNDSRKKYLMFDKTKDSQYRIAFYNREGYKSFVNKEVVFKYLLDTYKLLDGMF